MNVSVNLNSRRLSRVSELCSRLNLRIPILLAPMAGVRSPSLSIQVMNAGGSGACGALLMPPDEIREWTHAIRASSDGPFQLNTWIPDPDPSRDPEHEVTLCRFLSEWGPPVTPAAGDQRLPDFHSQCEAMLAARPVMISSIMGLYRPAFVARLKSAGITWLATVSTVAEARAAEAAGADVIVAQGAEAGGHRSTFDAASARDRQVGLFSLLPAVVDSVGVPVIATGGIADERGIAAAIMLGASAVQIGSAFLRCPESEIHPAWRSTLETTRPEDTTVTAVFSGRPGRAVRNQYVRAATDDSAPGPAPYPVQRGLTARMRAKAVAEGQVDRMQMWAGQSSALGSTMPAAELAVTLWSKAQELLND